MAYKVITGFEDVETGVFYDIHTEIEEDNENIEKYIEAGVVVGETPKKEPTVTEIKALLDEKGIEYDVKAKKDELLELLGD